MPKVVKKTVFLKPEPYVPQDTCRVLKLRILSFCVRKSDGSPHIVDGANDFDINTVFIDVVNCDARTNAVGAPILNGVTIPLGYYRRYGFNILSVDNRTIHVEMPDCKKDTVERMLDCFARIGVSVTLSNE